MDDLTGLLVVVEVSSEILQSRLRDFLQIGLGDRESWHAFFPFAREGPGKNSRGGRAERSRVFSPPNMASASCLPWVTSHRPR